MATIIKFRNNIRQFCRKQDEIVTPLLRFVWMFIVFLTIQKLFGYSSLASKTEVTVLLAIIAALLPDGFMFFMAGVVIGLHSFSISLEVGAVFVLLFAIMYCIYVRFFPNYAYAVLLVPVFYLIGIPYAAPIVIALVAGLGGVVPGVFGVVLYFFSQCAAEIAKLLKTEEAENEIEALKQLSEVILRNKEMYTCAMIFAMTILITSILLKFSYDYALYIAIAAGTIVNILGSLFAGYVMNQDVPTDKVILGSVIGIVIAFIIRFGQGILDYKHTERVQFEDDDYYYYVKAVPKLDSEKAKNKKTKTAQQKKPQAKKPQAMPPQLDQTQFEQPQPMQPEQMRPQVPQPRMNENRNV